AGNIPTPQSNSLFVERASCPFWKQAISPLPNPTHSLWNGHLARSGSRQDAQPPTPHNPTQTQTFTAFSKGKPSFSRCSK
ncbi:MULTISPECIES: hypothetical protein, partial [unclassified Microcoleus]|uniref:hypothetical protein n=1 Tax=unclassified Microcoleus TaxID=2642155 RepID=UPI002FCFC38F